MEKQCEGQMNIFEFISNSIEKVAYGVVFRYLRYGPHTLIPEVREKARKAIEEYGIPDNIHVEKWNRTLPCENCTHSKGGICYSGAILVTLNLMC